MLLHSSEKTGAIGKTFEKMDTKPNCRMSSMYESSTLGGSGERPRSRNAWKRRMVSSCGAPLMEAANAALALTCNFLFLLILPSAIFFHEVLLYFSFSSSDEDELEEEDDEELELFFRTLPCLSLLTTLNVPAVSI